MQIVRMSRELHQQGSPACCETALRSKAQAGCRELICEHSMFLSQVSSQIPGYSQSREK